MAKLNISNMTTKFRSVGGSIYMLVPPAAVACLPKDWISGVAESKEREISVDIENDAAVFTVK
jgi:hypothetical protein